MLTSVHYLLRFSKTKTYLKVTALIVAPSARFPHHLPTSSVMDECWILTCITCDLAGRFTTCTQTRSHTNTHTLHSSRLRDIPVVFGAEVQPMPILQWSGRVFQEGPLWGRTVLLVGPHSWRNKEFRVVVSLTVGSWSSGHTVCGSPPLRFLLPDTNSCKCLIGADIIWFGNFQTSNFPWEYHTV